jgi:hypothetical protein
VNKKRDKNIEADQKAWKGKKNEKPIYSLGSCLKISSQNGYKKVRHDKYRKPIKVDNDEVIKEIT